MLYELPRQSGGPEDIVGVHPACGKAGTGGLSPIDRGYARRGKEPGRLWLIASGGRVI